MGSVFVFCVIKYLFGKLKMVYFVVWEEVGIFISFSIIFKMSIEES